MTIHILDRGLPLCGQFVGVPSSWPPGNKWVDRSGVRAAAFRFFGDGCDKCVEKEKELRVTEQWPKRCACARSYVLNEWRMLELARNQNSATGIYRDRYATQEMRNCLCGSTLVVLVEVHDLTEE